MAKVIKKIKIFSFKKKAFSVALLLVLCFTAVLTIAQAQPVSVDPNSAVFTSQNKIDTSNRGRAPEPSTVALMSSGFLAAMIRFARRKFDEFKRGLDVAMSIVGLIISLPILAFAIILIKMSSKGPVLFRQTRVGRDGEVFELFKLRTMVFDAEKQTGPVWAKENDPRVTSVGKFLRKSHVDEIPQLVNVLKGEMSLIGPRPERPEFVSKLSGEISDYPKRLRIRPGITGLAQVKHSYDSNIRDVRKKVKLDLLYIKRMCFLTDLRILLNTVAVVLTGRGAR